MVKKRKSEFAAGLEHLMNHTPMNPFTPNGSAVFKQMSQASGLPLSQMLKHIGKASKVNADQVRIQNRLGMLAQENKSGQ
jgi:hypothetical protein